MKTFIEDLRDQISSGNNILQARAHVAKENIEQSFDELISSPHNEDLTIKSISKKSGYAVGTIYRYFKKIDDLFINQFLIRVEASNQELVQLLNKHEPHQTVDELITAIVDFSFGTWSKKGVPYIKRMVLRYVLRRSNCPEKFDTVFDDVLPSLYKIVEDDTSGTFKKMDRYQLDLSVRAFRAAVRSPFVRGDTLSGSKLHYEAVVDIGIKLFKN